MTLSRPIRPDEIVQAKTEVFPPQIFEVVNAAIALNWDGRIATIYADDIKAAIIEKIGRDAWKSAYLDFEPIYREAGWNVEYDGPAYNESYRGHYKFRKK